MCVCVCVCVCACVSSHFLLHLLSSLHISTGYTKFMKDTPFSSNCETCLGLKTLFRSMSRASAQGTCTTVWVLDISNAWRGIWRRSSSYTSGSGIGQVTMGSGLLVLEARFSENCAWFSGQPLCVSPLNYSRERIGSHSFLPFEATCALGKPCCGWLLLRLRVHLDMHNALTR